MKPYFLHDGTVQSGPFSLEELEQKEISKDTLVWKTGMPDWKCANDIEELKGLFETAAPPVFTEKRDLPESQKKELPDSAINQNMTKNSHQYFRKNLLVIGAVILLAGGGGLFWYFNKAPKKMAEAPPIIALKKDSVAPKVEVHKDTVKEISMDSITALLSMDSSNISKKSGTTDHGGFAIGGMSVQQEKPVSAEKELKKEKKSPPKPEQRKRQVETTEKKEDKPQTVAIKNLVISGTFRKNLLLEAVLEGSIRNPNNQVSFHNIIVTATFLNADGEQTGSLQYRKEGSISGGGSTSFKFKGNAPKGSKAARFSVSAIAVQ